MAAQLKMNVWIEFVGTDGVSQRRKIAVVERIVDGARLDEFGLSLEEGKAIQGRLQEEADQASLQDRECHDCDRLRGVHDYRSRTVHSLFGICRLRVPRFRSCACGKTLRSDTGSIKTLLKGRATPELERVQAEPRLSFREAARVLDLFVPAIRDLSCRTLRACGLEPVDLAFGLSVAPGQFDGVVHGINISAQDTANLMIEMSSE